MFLANNQGCKLMGKGIIKANTGTGVRISLFEGLATCKKCGRKFDLTKITKKDSSSRRTMSRNMTNWANIDRHLRACQGEMAFLDM